jgi:hypothetical protein
MTRNPGAGVAINERCVIRVWRIGESHTRLQGEYGP